MHRPPAVSYSVVRSRRHGVSLFLIWAVGALLTQVLFWQNYSPVSLLALEVVCLLSGIWAVMSWRNAPIGLLQWDGDRWHWSGFGEQLVHRTTVHFDLQGVVVVSLHCRARSGPVWLWLESAGRPQTTWFALRRALVASYNRPAHEPGQDVLGDLAP
jgi:hypothetical protein